MRLSGQATPHALAWLITLTILHGTVNSAAGDEAAIRANLRQFFETSEAARRAQLAKEIAADPDFDRPKLGDWLHTAGLFARLEPGAQEISVALKGGESRSVSLRIPRSYDANRRYPLLYALHGTGGSGGDIIRYFESILGERIEEFVIAAPNGYQGRVLHDGIAPNPEHRAVLLAVKKLAHIDSDRIYVSGYSLGGHTTWTLAMLLPDEFAAAIPIAGSLILPEVDRLWPETLPNLVHLPVYCIWGAHDTGTAQGDAPSPQGGIAGLNRRLVAECKRLNLSVVGEEDPEKGHGGIVPSPAILDQAFAQRRVRDPNLVEKNFRFVDQAHAYWVEAIEWKGRAWTEAQLKGEIRAGETPGETVAREIRTRLGRLTGKRAQNAIRVDRKQLDDLVVWIGDGDVDWTRPVGLNLSGTKSFEAILTPDLLVCLNEAARTYDFERLRWAGLRVRGGQKARVITGEMQLPPPGTFTDPPVEKKP